MVFIFKTLSITMPKTQTDKTVSPASGMCHTISFNALTNLASGPHGEGEAAFETPSIGDISRHLPPYLLSGSAR